MSDPASAQTSEWTFCATEGGVCSFTGTREVRYGANGIYVYATFSNGTACTNSVFTDPVPGQIKQCETRPISDWTVCAPEGGTCVFAGTMEVRYGANGAYFYKTLSNGTACTNSVFGDPAPNQIKQCATRPTSNWTVCAAEGGTCTFSGTIEVRYGTTSAYTYKTLSNGTACTNGVFGDPAPGQIKQCSTPTPVTAPTWTVCAPEGGTCAFSGTLQVRYGANGAYFYKTLSNGTACTNAVFGDPIFGTPKTCAIPSDSSTAWTFCVAEGGTCAFSGTREVRYGANGIYFYRTVSGGVACTNGVFGDPLYGVAKHCDTATSFTTTNAAPIVSLTAPADGATFQLPASVTITAAASDPDGTVTVVEFYAESTFVGSDTTSPYGVTWSNASAGSYGLTAVARDNSDGVTVSGARTITVYDPLIPGRAVFTASTNHDTAVDRYFLEIFPAGANPSVANPVATQDLGKPPVVNGECTADVRQTIANLPSGNYIATVTAIGPGGSARSSSASFTR